MDAFNHRLWLRSIHLVAIHESQGRSPKLCRLYLSLISFITIDDEVTLCFGLADDRLSVDIFRSRLQTQLLLVGSETKGQVIVKHDFVLTEFAFALEHLSE